MKVLVLILSMFVSEMSISAPKDLTFTVKTEELGMMRPAGGGPRAMVARIRARVQARKAAKAQKAAQAQQAAPVAAGQ